MKPLLILIFLTGTGEKPQMEGAVSQGKILWFSVKVRDKSGRAVPNAQVALIAVDPEGNEYGPTFRWRTGAGTDAEGRGGMGFGNPVKSKPGKVVIVVTHPSISETRMAVEWSDILHERRPTRQTEPVFVLQARGGPGQAAWRKSVARKAPGLVKRLLEAEDEKEIDAITKELDAGEIGSFPALVDALQDYRNPRRKRLVRALNWTWTGCRNLDSIDPDLRRKVFAVVLVNSHGIALQWGRANHLLHDEIRAEDVQLYYPEVVWAVRELEAEIRAARQTGDLRRAASLEPARRNLRETEKHFKELHGDDRD